MEELNQFKFFIVDDDAFCANLYKQFLNNLNHKDITHYSNGNDCLNNLSLNPDIIFLDHDMDDMTGFEVLKKIKRFNPNIYVVIVSGQDSINTAVDSLKYGAFDYLIKDESVCEKMKTVIEKIIKVKEELRKTNRNTIQKLLSFFV